MDAFTTHTGVGVPLRRTNVDTDQIIPAEYLKRVTRTGFEDGLFSAWRKDPSFVLNQPTYAEGSVLVAGSDFGTGSSREHAVWALRGAGIAAVIAPNFARIYYRNSINNGFLALEAPDIVGAFQDGDEATLDLAGGTVINTRTGVTVTFVPVPQFALDVQRAGGWLEYMRDHSQAEVEAEELDSASVPPHTGDVHA